MQQRERRRIAAVVPEFGLKGNGGRSFGISKKYGTEISLFNLSGGDFIQMDFIKKNFTYYEFYKWIGINNYIIKKAEERANG